MAYSGSAASAANAVTWDDTTTAASAGALNLVKLVQNLNTGSTALGTSHNALPGNPLAHRLSLTNQDNSSLTTLLVNDATPTFTTFLSATCPAASAMVCRISRQLAVGEQGGLQ